MSKTFTYVLIVLSFFIAQGSTGQVDGILQPAEIHPPKPTLPQVQKESKQQLAAQYFRNRDFEKAVVLYEQLYEESNISYYTYYLYCLVELGDFKKAEKVVKQQIRQFPGKQKYNIDLGYVYTESGDTGKGKKQFDEVIKNLPEQKGMLVEMANAFLYRNQTDYAVAVYTKGRRLIDDPFYQELGNLYMQTRSYSNMIDTYLDWVDYDYMNTPTVEARLQTVLQSDTDNSLSKYLREALLNRIHKNPEKIYFSEMLVWLSIQNKDFETALSQARSIDRRQNEDGYRLLDLARICIDNQAYDVAIESFNTVLKKGKNNVLYHDAKIGLLYTHYLKVTHSNEYTNEDVFNLEQEYQSVLDEYGKNANNIIIMQYLGHLQAFYLNKAEDATQLLQEAILVPNANPIDVSNVKIELADVMILTGDVWEAKLLYGQVEKEFKQNPLGFEAKFKNAKLSFYLGEYGWAKAQLDVLKAATSKLIANDALYLSLLIGDNLEYDSITGPLDLYAEADLLLYQRKEEQALAKLDSLFIIAPHNPILDEALLKKADIKFSQQKFAEAADILSGLVSAYPKDITADNALFMLARITEFNLDQPEKAQELYGKLLKDYQGSLFSIEARKRFRILRGDFNNESPTDEEKLLFQLENN